MKYSVKNVPQGALDYKFMIIRDCGSDNYWYYGASNDLVACHRIANEIGNGIVVETENIES